MKKIGGFKIRRKLVKAFKWIFRPRRIDYLRPPTRYHNPFSKICSYARFLGRGTKGLSNSDPGYIQLGEGGVKRVRVPKGHLAVYVGGSETETRREVLPVIYFNHPLFGDLLKEAERVYGFNPSGGITLPCGISEFERVKMRIANWEHCRRNQHRRYLS